LKEDHHSELISELWFHMPSWSGDASEDAEDKKYLAQAFGEIIRLSNETKELRE